MSGERELGERPADAPTPLRLFGLEFSLATTSLDALEEVARSVTPEWASETFAELRSTQELVRLVTCHRVELLGLSSAVEEPARWLGRLPGAAAGWRRRSDREVVDHLFRVAAGRESLAFGEAEVRDQVRAAGARVESRHPRPVLRALLGDAADAAEATAGEGSPARSVAAIAADHLLAGLGQDQPRVVVVGSGIVGRQVVERLGGRARVTLVYHRSPPSEAFLRATGAAAIPLADLPGAIARAEAVVTAAKFGDHGLGATDLPRDRPLWLVDLGMPRNIDPDVREIPSVRLIDLEELHRIAERPPDRRAPSDRLSELAEASAERLERALLEPWIEAIRRSAESVRRSELERARAYLGALDADQEVAVDRLTQRLVARLLLSPTERVRAFPAGPDGDRQRRWAVELLRPGADPP